MDLLKRTFSQILEAFQDAALVIRRDGKILYANSHAANLFGDLQKQETIQNLVTEAQLENLTRKLDAFWTSSETLRIDLVARRKNGFEFPVTMTFTLVELVEGLGAICIVQDTSKSKLIDFKIHRKNRVLATINACNQLILQASDETKLLNAICETCVELGDYRKVWIGYIENDALKTVRPVAQKGFERGYPGLTNLTWANDDPGKGPGGTQNKSLSTIAFPLISGEKVLGTLNVSSAEVDGFDTEEAEYLKELAANLADGIESLRTRFTQAQLEQTLLKNEERYHLISTVASDYMFSSRVDADGKLTFNWVAGAFSIITGYSFEEYIAHGGWRAALHPGDLEIDDRDLAKLRSNQSVISEIRTLHKNGQTIWVKVYAHPELDAESKQLTGIYGAVQDITERKRAEELIEASERRLSLIFDTVGDVIFLLTVEQENCFRFVSINPAFLTLTGLTREQVIGKRMEEVLPEAVHAFVKSKYNRAIQENKTVRWEEVSSYPTGTLYGEVAVTPYIDAAGVCTHLVGSVHDITEIRHAEDEIRKLNQELEQRVATRTAQLQAANKEMESFSYSVSHDLRAPLRAISGFASIIARRHRASLNEEGRHYVDNIVQASERMGQLIDDLLTYSRLGRAGVRRVPIPMGDLFTSLENDLDARLHQIGGTLRIEGQLPTILGDKTLIYQIFSNLIENAMTYRRSELPLEITISAHSDDNSTTFQVHDNGIGIPPEYFEKIFNIFQRLHNDDEYPGTGIGLATVKKSVELLGGSVWVESTTGEGSMFFVKLPRN